MNKEHQLDDNKIAEDTAIESMNREYNAVLGRRRLLALASIMKSNKVHNPHICRYNYDNVARAYFLEQDILLSLNFLYMKARLESTKRCIKEIIHIKEKCASMLLSIYMKGTSHTLTYSPNIIDRMNYNALYEEISYMETSLLARLTDIDCICKIMSLEHTAALMLHSIKP